MCVRGRGGRCQAPLSNRGQAQVDAPQCLIQQRGGYVSRHCACTAPARGSVGTRRHAGHACEAAIASSLPLAQRAHRRVGRCPAAAPWRAGSRGCPGTRSRRGWGLCGDADGEFAGRGTAGREGPQEWPACMAGEPALACTEQAEGRCASAAPSFAVARTRSGSRSSRAPNGPQPSTEPHRSARCRPDPGR